MAEVVVTVMVVKLLFGVAILAVPLTTVQVPVPVLGELAFIVNTFVVQLV